MIYKFEFSYNIKYPSSLYKTCLEMVSDQYLYWSSTHIIHVLRFLPGWHIPPVPLIIWWSIRWWILFGRDYATRSYHIDTETNWSPYSRRHFQKHVCQRKCLYFYKKKSLKIVPIHSVGNKPQNWLWLGTETATRPYLNQSCFSFTEVYLRHSTSMFHMDDIFR